MWIMLLILIPLTSSKTVHVFAAVRSILLHIYVFKAQSPLRPFPTALVSLCSERTVTSSISIGFIDERCN